MKIDSYSVAMNAQYFDLKLASTEATISQKSQNLSDNLSSNIQIDELNQTSANETDNLLKQELSSAIVKNIHAESQREASRQIVGDRVELSTTRVEAQSLNFSLSAYVQTDGKEIELSLDVNLSRSFMQQSTLNIDQLVPKKLRDPLIINLDGSMPSLSSKNFSFDIDSDGKSDQISQLNAGNGFLALDRNNNGKIDDGSELFGTKSGDGFADLKSFDDDNNGWIDENDTIFDKLRVWEKTESKDRLITLGEKGIGAIFLGNTDTPFSLKSRSNELLGEIRKSSFVLYENGKAGVISQVDFAVETKTEEGLSLLDTIEKDINTLKIGKFYDSQKSASEEPKSDIEKIQDEIKELESKLVHANEKQKVSIQAKIDILLSQIMVLLEVS